jgi:pimeloyl-ACP methyl ester carboxylesterase
MPRRIDNPDFGPPPGGVASEWQRMRASPTGLERPLVVMSGWRAPRWPVAHLARRLRGLAGAGAQMVLPVSFTWCWSFAVAAAKAVAAVEERWPSADAEETVEVDVIGVSMGGIVARCAAVPGSQASGPCHKRLRIARLFTLASPHRGARLAERIAVDGTARDMRPGCDFLCGLDEAKREYELVCYARLNDWWVGATRAAPAGQEPIWRDAHWLLSHQTITLDPLISTELARRLRGEEPIGVASRPPCD